MKRTIANLSLLFLVLAMFSAESSAWGVPLVFLALFGVCFYVEGRLR